MTTKEITKDIIGVLIILGALASLFFSVNEAGEQTIRILAGAVIGYYYGSRFVPLGRGIHRKK